MNETSTTVFKGLGRLCADEAGFEAYSVEGIAEVGAMWLPRPMPPSKPNTRARDIGVVPVVSRGKIRIVAPDDVRRRAKLSGRPL